MRLLSDSYKVLVRLVEGFYKTYTRNQGRREGGRGGRERTGREGGRDRKVWHTHILLGAKNTWTMDPGTALRKHFLYTPKNCLQGPSKVVLAISVLRMPCISYRNSSHQ